MGDEKCELVERLAEYLECKGISRSQFADRCNIPRPTVSQMLSGRNKKIGHEILIAIHNAFPDLSMQWLVFGEGNYSTENKSTTSLENALFANESDNQSEYSIVKPFQQSSKEITKIVVFFSDNSFAEYCLKK